MGKQDARKLPCTTLQHQRYQIVYFLKQQRGTQRQAARIFGFSLRAVNQIWAVYKRQGKKGLLLKKRGPTKSQGALTASLRKDIKQSIIANTPDAYGLQCFLWTSETIRVLIKQKTGMLYSSRHIRRLLAQWGFTAQKPARRAYEQDAQLVKAWLRDEYVALARRAKRQKALIFWEDETGMRSDHNAGRTYAPKGRTPVVGTTGQRFRLNMVSAISNKGHLQFSCTERAFNTDAFIAFMEKLIKSHIQMIILITDRHPSHKTQKVQTWLAAHKKKLELFMLPPYSPELNPDEYFNQDLKTNAVGKSRPQNKEELAAIVTTFAKRKKKNPQLIKNYFKADKVKYAA